MENKNKMESLFVIINAGHADELVELLREAGAGGATILNSRGEGVRHESFMGITIDAEKEMVVCVVEKDTAEKAMEMIKERMGMHTPVHGVCFTMPIDRMVGFNVPLPKPEENKE